MKKRVLLFVLACLFLQALPAQSQLDSIFTNGEVLLVNVREVEADAIKFSYPGEEVINTLYKNAVEKVVFRSGRTQVFQEAASYKTVQGPEDWENVSPGAGRGRSEGFVQSR